MYHLFHSLYGGDEEKKTRKKSLQTYVRTPYRFTFNLTHRQQIWCWLLEHGIYMNETHQPSIMNNGKILSRTDESFPACLPQHMRCLGSLCDVLIVVRLLEKPRYSMYLPQFTDSGPLVRFRSCELHGTPVVAISPQHPEYGIFPFVNQYSARAAND